MWRREGLRWREVIESLRYWHGVIGHVGSRAVPRAKSNLGIECIVLCEIEQVGMLHAIRLIQDLGACFVDLSLLLVEEVPLIVMEVHRWVLWVRGN